MEQPRESICFDAEGACCRAQKITQSYPVNHGPAPTIATGASFFEYSASLRVAGCLAFVAGCVGVIRTLGEWRMTDQKARAAAIQAKVKAAIERAAALSDRVDRGMARILYDDVPTFMEAPFYDDVNGGDVVVAGFPYEGVKVRDPRTLVPAAAARQDPAIYARAGACDAPAAIRRHSIHYSLDHSPGGYFPERGRTFRIADAVTVCDAGDLPVNMRESAEDIQNQAGDKLRTLLGEDRLPVVLGGDDTVPYVGMRAVRGQRPGKIAVVKLDSHFDLAWEPRFWAGSQWAACIEAGYIDPENLALVGMRGLRNRTMLHEIATELGIPYWTLQDIEERGIVAVIEEALAAVAVDADWVYLSLDLDVVDPAFLPAQKYPEPAGLTARETLRALRTVIDRGPALCGFDMACLGPDYDVNGLGAQLAARCAVEVIGGYAYRRAKGAA